MRALMYVTAWVVRLSPFCQRTEEPLKQRNATLFLFAGACASLGSYGLAQTTPQAFTAVKPQSTTIVAQSPASLLPLSTQTHFTDPSSSGSDEAARAALKQGVEANAAGDLTKAEQSFRSAMTLAPAGEAGDRVALDASKRLGFLALDRRDLRAAETFFGAEAILARRLYFSGKITPRAFADSVQRFASVTGSMGRSGESAALSFYAQEIKSRAQAEASSQVLNRDTNDPADAVGNVRVAASGLCVVGRDKILKDRLSCEDEAGARSEALALQARQIKASAPPPLTKEEREAKEAKKKGKGG
ncbi:hypothetical protein [Candidatus Phycosocius spiralis]|uniref:Tetratricopeptide repeat protein n=1 Tax=Candidatus Phycosocius spiralis TaxID=2815099 RepID=A0ABQ4PXQ3_9PROT|nr:hypothetical protein [Candidatus Phycosocius spiralis]GIU67473.1 hypothetical protein PsB1_1627 [Candidatus Phycosocius spiralis]